MSIIRKYKISKITGIPLAGLESECISFMKGILEDLIPFKEENCPDSIFYMNSKGDWIFEQDNKNDVFYVRYDIVWSILQSEYNIKGSEIQEFIKYMVEEAFKQRVSTPSVEIIDVQTLVEEAFKQRVSTPFSYAGSYHTLVEEAFKQRVSTPVLLVDIVNFPVEEAFKQRVSTPHSWLLP